MDRENFTANIVVDDNDDVGLPDDLELDVWFGDPDIAEFLDSVRRLKHTRATIANGDHPAVEKARAVLEAKILNNGTLTWVRVPRRSLFAGY